MKAKDHPAYKPELTLAAKLAADKAKLKAHYDKKKGKA